MSGEILPLLTKALGASVTLDPVVAIYIAKISKLQPRLKIFGR